MNITDFLPKYPNIHDSDYSVLNPYDEKFYETLFRKKEFYENKLEKAEIFPQERGLLTKYQKTIARYMSSRTPYDKVLLIHAMGSGKTCSAIGAIEQIREEDSKFDGALIFAKGTGILENFVRELVEKCTAGQYIPDGYNRMTMKEKLSYSKKKTKFYQLRTFAKFAKKIKNFTDGDIIDSFSNKIIVVDEVHNLRIQDKKKEEDVMTYEQFHRFLHIVKNCKIIFLSGTPMKDSPAEIASVANLLLPLDNQFPTEEDFLEKYMFEDSGTYLIKQEKIPEFKNRLKGLISFLRESSSSIQKEFIGKSKIGKLKHFIVEPNYMSKFQSKVYKNAWNQDKGGQKGVYTNSREASLFVYPNKTYGHEGFSKYIIENKKAKDETSVSSFKMNEELEKSLKGENNDITLENIKKYSITYYRVIKEIFDTNGCCFIYSSIVQGSGAIVFSLLLSLLGFKRGNGSEKSQGLRYVLLTNKTATNSDIRKIVDRFNKPDNIHGEIIKVIIGSRAVAEGFSFKNIIFESINTPHWNYSETAQALARGIRLGSHNDLYKAGENPIVKILQPIAMCEDESISIDLQMYETSEDKDISIRRILRLLMELAFDCGLNYLRNHVKDKKGSRECDYMTCNYKCDGLDMDQVINGIDEKDLDFSTYQLYYANPKIPTIRKKIEHLFRENNQLDIDSIFRNLKDKFSEEEIRNSLIQLEEESKSEEFDYKTFLDVYSRSSVKKITNKIEELFKDNFKLEINSIYEQFPEKTKFEVLIGLRELINNSTVIINKYGFPCYLREEKNVYFLVSNVGVKPDFYTEYYSKYPSINVPRTFDEIINKLFSMSLPILITQICKTKDEKIFVKLIKSLPIQIQELFIEASIIAKKQGIDKNVITNVLNLYGSYIKKVDKTTVSTFLETLRCLKKGGGINDWKDCNDYKDKIVELEKKKIEDLKETNEYGVIGKYNPENGSFCIVDFTIEEKVRKNISEKRSKGQTDRRLSYSGKVCGAGGWKLQELMNYAINRLKIKPPVDYLIEESDLDLREKITGNDKLMAILDENDVENADTDTLRTMCYWGLPKKEGGIASIQNICNGMREWFKEHNLLIEDNQCGVQGKKKGTSLKTELKEFRMESMTPEDNRDRFNAHLKDIEKLIGECQGTKKYKVKGQGDHTWVLAYLKKKLVGLASVDKNGEMFNVYAAKNYRRKQIDQQAMQSICKIICNITKKPPLLKVDNFDKDAKKTIKKYEGYGFRITESTDKYTIFTNSCV